MNSRWEAYLYERHSRETLRRWANGLSFFRFVRAVGGHANDFDQFLVSFRCANLESYSQLCTALGIAEEIKSEEHGTGQIASLGNDVADWHLLTKPTRHVEIHGKNAFVYIQSQRVNISVGSDYDVNEDDFLNASRIEVVLRNVKAERVDPPIDSHHCLCPKHYAELFA